MALPRFIPNYKVDDYRLWEGDWELWSGVAVAMSPSAKRRHQEVCSELHFRLRQALEAVGCRDCSALYELDWIVSDDTVLRPDLLVICGEEIEDYVYRTPPLVVEVLSESTRKRDLVYKREMYEQLGVKYYLTVDPDDGTCQILENSEGGFQQLTEGELELHERCRISLNLSDLARP